MKHYCVRALFTVLERCLVHRPVFAPVYGLPQKPDFHDLVLQLYQEMLTYSSETRSENNCTNNILDLRRKYSLPLEDENISDMFKPARKYDYHVFSGLLKPDCHKNSKIVHLRCNIFKPVDYSQNLISNCMSFNKLVDLQGLS